MATITRSTEAFKEFETYYWSYYRELENEFLLTRRYVDFDVSNNSAFSVEFLKLYQAVCSEIDVIGKAMASIVNSNFTPEDRANSIYKWWYEIQNVFLVVECPFTKLNNTPTAQAYPLRDYKCYLLDSIMLHPWKNFEIIYHPDKKKRMRFDPAPGSQVPSWWSDYNKVKHTRTMVTNGKINYGKANFGNLCQAIAALYTLEHAYMDMVGTEDDLQSFMDFSVLFVKPKRYTMDETEKLFDAKGVTLKEHATHTQSENNGPVNEKTTS